MQLTKSLKNYRKSIESATGKNNVMEEKLK